MHANEPVGGTHFIWNGFARRLVLTPRQKTTRKWPISSGASIKRERKKGTPSSNSWDTVATGYLNQAYIFVMLMLAASFYGIVYILIILILENLASCF